MPENSCVLVTCKLETHIKAVTAWAFSRTVCNLTLNRVSEPYFGRFYTFV